ncbi:MAG TPA: GreA/GreB family elongation factor [Candidatus Dojkabacteria bacterium]|jgi:transcription elongation factor GreA
MKKLISESKEKIKKIEEELEFLAERLDQERKEDNMEENLAIQNELMDKKQYLEEQLGRLKKSIARLSKKNFPSSKNEVSIGAATVINLDGKQLKMTIVTPVQADPTRGLISSESPIGEALLGQKIGSTVEVTTPNGIKTYSVVGIED